jgi:hypothetical protein
MARRMNRPAPASERILQPLRRLCPVCGHPMQIQYHNTRSITALQETVLLKMKIRRWSGFPDSAP